MLPDLKLIGKPLSMKNLTKSLSNEDLSKINPYYAEPDKSPKFYIV